MTNTARLYQLEHQHTHVGTWISRREGKKSEVQIKYGFITIKDTNGTNYIHGLLGSTATRVVETVEKRDFRIGDRIRLDDGTCGEISSTQAKYIDEKQLRFVQSSMADVATTLTLRAIEGAK